MSIVSYIRNNNLTSGEERHCRKCGGFHYVFYYVHEGGEKHLVSICNNNSFVYLPREEGLDIPYINDIKKKMEADGPETKSMDL